MSGDEDTLADTPSHTNTDMEQFKLMLEAFAAENKAAREQAAAENKAHREQAAAENKAIREQAAKDSEAMFTRMDERFQASEKRHEEEKNELVNKLTELTTAAAASENESNVTLTQPAKFQRVLSEFRKTTRVKEFSPLQMGVDEWLQAVFDEVTIIAESKGMKAVSLTDQQKVLLVRSRLPPKIVNQLDVFMKRESLTFESITFVRFIELFQKHGGKSVPAITAVMKLYGPDRIKKARETEMLHHTLDF